MRLSSRVDRQAAVRHTGARALALAQAVGDDFAHDARQGCRVRDRGARPSGSAPARPRRSARRRPAPARGRPTSSSRKCVKMCTTVPGTGHQSARTGAARSASLAGGSRSRPLRARAPRACRRAGPASARWRSSTWPSSRSARKAMPTRCGRSALLQAQRQRRLRCRARAAAQSLCSGHIRHDGRLRRADAGAEIHHRLREVAGAARRRQRRGEALQLGLRRRAAAGARRTGARPRARCCRRPASPSRRRRSPRWPPPCRARCPAARSSSASVDGKRAAVTRRRRPGALVQVAGAAVVAEARPGGEHVVERRRGQRLDRRPAREEALDSRG